MRILVVDDDRDMALRNMALMVVMLLDRRGHDVEEAHDAEVALDKVQQFKPQVVALNIGLPGMDGRQLAAAMRRDSAGPQLRLIARTGFGEGKDWERALEAGFGEYLVKPLQPQALLGAIGSGERGA